MANKLPGTNYFDFNTVTQQQHSDGLNDTIDYLASINGSESLVISAGSISPSKCILTIDTEASASTDDLDTISTANLLASPSDGLPRIVWLKIKDSARKITLRHAQGGSGQILTYNGANITLESTSATAMLIWDDTNTSWNLVGVMWNDSSQPHRYKTTNDSYGLEAKNTTGPAGFKAYRSQSVTGTVANFDGYGQDMASASVKYGSIEVVAKDNTTGAHDGSIVINSVQNTTEQQEAEFFNGATIGNPTGGNKGLGTINVSSGYYVNNKLLPVIEKAISSNLSIPTGNGYVDFTHNLSGAPQFVSCWLKATTANNGYAVNDMINISNGQDFDESSGPSTKCWGIISNSTIIRFTKFGDIQFATKDGTSNFIPSSSDWVIVIAAMYLA